jgi:DNA relaxase NicK
LPEKWIRCSITDAAIDWFTATYDDKLRAQFASAKARQLLARAEDQGEKPAYTNRLGFIGDRVDGFFAGWRADTLMVISSGAKAHELAPFFLNLATKVTRLDIAVTLLDSEVHRDWSKIAYNQVREAYKQYEGPLTTHRIEGTPDGRTLYVGARSSDRFIRIYDKTAESKGEYPPRSWRWEVEYKHPRAGICSARLARDGYTTDAVLDVCRSALKDVGITLPCDGISSGWVAERPKQLTTNETRLTYTTRVVAPFIKHLIDAVGEARVIEALENANLGQHWRSIPKRRRDAP